jgi:hypothetical protein
MLRVRQRAFGDFIGKAQPASVQPVEEADEGFVLMVDFLKMQIDEFTDPAEKEIVDDEAVELVAVNRQMAKSLILPHVLSIDGHSDQVRHQIGQSLIVIAFNPNNFSLPLGIRKFANAGEKLPVFPL